MNENRIYISHPESLEKEDLIRKLRKNNKKKSMKSDSSIE